MNSPNDREAHLAHLLSRIARKDERALRELMYQFNTRIQAFAWNKLRTMEDAEEVVADTFEAVWKSAHTFEGRSSVATWIFGIAERRVLMKLRSGRKHEDHDDVEDIADTLAGEFPDPSELLLAKQHHEFFKDCAARLSEAHRACLILQFISGLSDAEIAETTGEPLGTVKSRLHHARINMTRCIQRKLSPPGQH
jgi:RNA polymerase sigma-70 factor (ECF subfamily)